MSDLISRSDAIEALTDRPHGEWKHNKTYSSMDFCSECGMPFLHEDKYPRNYCPNCGTKMDKGGDDK